MLNLPKLPAGYKYPNPTEKIGAGGYGTVYKIWDEQNQKYKALKILDKKEDLRTVQRFKIEMETLEKISHPNIVEIEYANANDLYYIMEYLESGVLSYSKEYDFVELLTIFKQVAQALYFAHRLGLVHRDLKPQNILFDRNGKVKISDFGIVRVIGSNITVSVDFLGTPIYMAPEQIRDIKNVQHYVDLWALSVIMYKFLTKQYPYGDGELNTYAKIHSILEHQLIPVLEMNPELEQIPGGKDIASICERNLQRDCSLRYQDAMSVAVDVDSIIYRISKPVYSPRATLLKNIAEACQKFLADISCSKNCSQCNCGFIWQDFMDQKAFFYTTTRGRLVRWLSCCQSCFDQMPSVVERKPCLKLLDGVVLSYLSDKFVMLRESPKNSNEMIERGHRAFSLIEKMPPHNLSLPYKYEKLSTAQAESYFMIYPYKPGFYLKPWIKTKPEWTTELVTSVALQVLQGLNFLHENGLVYRALTPSSVFITLQGEVLLDNFFLTKSQKNDSLLKTGQTITLEQPLGFLEYMSPEQIANSVNVDQTCDIWSFGVVCYYLFSGHIPFSGEGSYQMAMAITQKPHEPLPAQVSEKWKSIIDKCLQKEPSKRFQSVMEIYLELTND